MDKCRRNDIYGESRFRSIFNNKKIKNVFLSSESFLCIGNNCMMITLNN